MSRLTHPHILAVHDSGIASGHPYYVMPFISGESLRSRLNREKQLPVDECLRLFHEIAGALAHAHQHGVVHRDIKPENILLADAQPIHEIRKDIPAAVASAIAKAMAKEPGSSICIRYGIR